PIQELLKFNLEKQGFLVSLADNGGQALAMAAEIEPDLIMLDIMLPGMDGLEVCKLLRQNPKLSSIPVIMLTARSEEMDKVLGLELGADDYITKPFSPRELVARVKARLRRHSGPPDGNLIKIGDLQIDTERFMASVRGQQIDLTPKEMELLKFLAGKPGKVFARDYLLEKIWGYDFAGDSRTVDVHIRHLRQKVEADPANPQIIETVRGVGYRFRQER
ncbi:MAG TPA: response regulator transcription factor, partial [Verrucomicrobiae bacterium]|nr:response regulator transcription factor [Verrucomicrobiae bacterium]